MAVHRAARLRRGAFMEYRKWMVRNFSLTLAAVSLRIYLQLSMVLEIDDLDQEVGSFHGPEVDMHHSFDRAELSRHAAQVPSGHRDSLALSTNGPRRDFCITPLHLRNR